MRKRTAAMALAVCAAVFAASIATPALGGPSVGSIAKKAKKALKIGKSAQRTARSAASTANAAKSTANAANSKADQALARPVVTASGITPAASPTAFVPPSEVGSAIAFCPSGQRAISGGGAMISGLGDGLAVSMANEARSAWFVVAVNNSASTTAELEATAYCAPAGGAVAARRADVRTEVAAVVDQIEDKLD